MKKRITKIKDIMKKYNISIEDLQDKEEDIDDLFNEELDGVEVLDEDLSEVEPVEQINETETEETETEQVTTTNIVDIFEEINKNWEEKFNKLNDSFNKIINKQIEKKNTQSAKEFVEKQLKTK